MENLAKRGDLFKRDLKGSTQKFLIVEVYEVNYIIKVSQRDKKSIETPFSKFYIDELITNRTLIKLNNE